MTESAMIEQQLHWIIVQTINVSIQMVDHHTAVLEVIDVEQYIDCVKNVLSQ